MVRQQMKLGFSIIEWSKSIRKCRCTFKEAKKMSSASAVVVSQLDFIELSYQNSLIL